MVDVDKGPTMVTGGAGFIGSHLCDRLLAAGVEELVCFDDLSTGGERNVAHLKGDSRFSLVKQDVGFGMDWKGPFARVYHLACPASPLHYSKDPVRTIRTAALGTWNALEVCRRTGARLVIASTSEVYGNPGVHPQTEDYHGNVNPQGPRSCYDEGKRAGEALAAAYRRQHGIDVRVARIFNTYGPRMVLDDGRVVTNFGRQALLGLPLEIYGSGTQTRSFCYVDDTVEGLIQLMECPERLQTVNLGKPDERTIEELAKLIIRLCHSPSKLKHRPLPEEDPKRRCPNISLARRALGWEPAVEIEVGLTRTLRDLWSQLEKRGEEVIVEVPTEETLLRGS